MELAGLKRSLKVIEAKKVQWETLVTERHCGVKKYMRENIQRMHTILIISYCLM